MTQWQAGYPPPEAAKTYEQLHPGAFAQMLAMAERAQQSQIESNFIVNEHIHVDNIRGMWLGTAVTVLAMVGSVTCAWLGQPWVASAFLGIPVLSVARVLIESTKKRG